jgi:hypothetical protein
VVADVVGSSSRWDADHERIYTVTTVEVVGTMKGSRRAGERVELVRIGGVVDDVEMRVVGDAPLIVGERAALFLGGGRGNPFLVGLAQGKRAAAWDPRQARWQLRDPMPGVAAAGSDLRSFVRTKTYTDPPHPYAWPNKCHAFELDEASAPPTAKSLFAPAFEAALGAWTTRDATCADLSLTATEAKARLRPANDRRNSVMFVTGPEWCDTVDGRRVCRDASILALTTVSSRSSTGEILDADIQLNAVNHSWGDLAAGSSADVDLQNALTHELGHTLGFDHTCRVDEEQAAIRKLLEQRLGHPVDDAFFAAWDVDDGGRQVPLCRGADDALKKATMTAQSGLGDTELRTLSAIDVAGVCSVYSAESGRPCEAPLVGGKVVGGCGCDLPRRSPARWWAIGVGALLVAVRRARRFSRAAGPRGATPPRA